MKNRIVLMFITILAFYSTKLEAQVYAYNNFTVTIYDVCNMRIFPSGTISLNLLATTAGNSILSQTNSSSNLQLTSIAPENQTRKITAIISSGDVPAGTLFKLTPFPCTVDTGTGSGTFGTASSTMILDRNVQQDVITGIGSCYSGTSSTSGYRLLYTWGVDPVNYNQLRATSTVSITITYTVISL